MGLADAVVSQVLALAPDEIYGWTERGHSAERYVKRLAGLGVVGGNPDGTFRPDEPISRAALVKLLVTAANLHPAPEEPLLFSDSTGHWAAEAGYIGAALKAGILRVTEYPGGNLKPDEPVTRAERARLLVRAAGIAENSAVKAPALFSDSSQIPLGLRPYVMLAVQEGLLTGIRGDNGTLTFDPEGDVTRAQATAVILRLMAR